MSELERWMSAWRQSLVRSDALTADDVRELDGHLSDSVADLTRVGLSQEEATLVALRRLGDPTALALEYRKASPASAWGRRWYWMTAGFLGFSLAMASVRSLAHLGAWLTLGTGAPGA